MSAALIVAGRILPGLATALASEFITDEAIARYVGFAASIVAHGFDADNRMAALADDIERMVAEDRNPTRQEWDALGVQLKVSYDEIMSWKVGQ